MGIHREKRKASRILLILASLVSMMLSACGWGQDSVFVSATQEGTQTVPVSFAEEDGAKEAAGEWIYVHVCGAVVSPGLKELPAGSRVWDALSLADGFTEEADVSAVNLAAPAEDGKKYYFPTVEETKKARTEESEGINLNTAREEDLLKLPGIGSAKAKAILKYRDDHGEFTDIAQLLEIPGIKQGLFDQISDRVRISDYE